MPDEPVDPVEALRRRLGVSDRPRPRAGGLLGGTFADRQRLYEERMRMLAEAGSDPHGREQLRRLFRRLGRR